MFEVNIVLLCHVQWVNIYSMSILKYSTEVLFPQTRDIFNAGRLGLNIKW